MKVSELMNQLAEIYSKYAQAKIEYADCPEILENLREPEIYVWETGVQYNSNLEPYTSDVIVPAKKLSYTPDGVYLILES